MREMSESDYYTNNLANVSKTNAVRAAENIYNEKGALLVPVGAIIHKVVA